MAITTISLSTAAISIIFGVLVLVFPKFLRYFIGIYLILIGILQLL